MALRISDAFFWTAVCTIMLLIMLTCSGCGTGQLTSIEQSMARLESQYVPPPGQELTPQQQAFKTVLGEGRAEVVAEKARREAGAATVESVFGIIDAIGRWLPPPLGGIATLAVGLGGLIFGNRRRNDLNRMATTLVRTAKANAGVIDTTNEKTKASLSLMGPAANAAIDRAGGMDV
jgi:hypothetical protein